MSRKNALDPKTVEQTINDYLQALKLAKGEAVMNQTHLSYRKGWFYLRPAGYSRDAPAIPCRPAKIEALTAELRKRIEPRADSDDDGEPD